MRKEGVRKGERGLGVFLLTGNGQKLILRIADLGERGSEQTGFFRFRGNDRPRNHEVRPASRPKKKRDYSLHAVDAEQRAAVKPLPTRDYGCCFLFLAWKIDGPWICNEAAFAKVQPRYGSRAFVARKEEATSGAYSPLIGCGLR